MNQNLFFCLHLRRLLPFFITLCAYMFSDIVNHDQCLYLPNEIHHIKSIAFIKKIIYVS